MRLIAAEGIPRIAQGRTSAMTNSKGMAARHLRAGSRELRSSFVKTSCRTAISLAEAIDELLRKRQEEWALLPPAVRVERLLADLKALRAKVPYTVITRSSGSGAGLVPLAAQIDLWCDHLAPDAALAKSRLAAAVFLSREQAQDRPM